MVKLLFITPDYAKTIEYAARTSTATDCKENSEDFVRKLVRKGHLSVGRHCDASFEIICSRACSHQLVRHTHLAYTQESQRYVKFPKISEENTAENWRKQVEELFIIPDSIRNNEKAYDLYITDCLKQNWFYYDLIDKYNIPKEDARYLLPNACKTRIIVSGNFQAFFDFVKLRTDKAAQWEIREIAEEIKMILLHEAPAFFEPLIEKINQEKQDKKNRKNSDVMQRVTRFQQLALHGIIHPLTCREDSSHGYLIPTIRDGKVVLACSCGYFQENIPECVFTITKDEEFNNQYLKEMQEQFKNYDCPFMKKLEQIEEVYDDIITEKDWQEGIKQIDKEEKKNANDDNSR